VVLPVGGEVGGVTADELVKMIEREFYSFDVLQLVAVIEELLEYRDDDVDTDLQTGLLRRFAPRNDRHRERSEAIQNHGHTQINDNGQRIFFEVDPDLSFPPSDVGFVGIDDYRVNDNGRVDNNDSPGATIRLPLMNLLGSSSPLPIRFSDHIARGRRDSDMYADFLSIMQNRLHTLWIDSQRKYSPDRSSVAEKIFESLAGLSIAGDRRSPLRMRDSECVDKASDCGHVDIVGANCVRPSSFNGNAGFFEYAIAGLRHLSNRTRSAQGLKELLYAAFGDIPISIEENVGRLAEVSNARPLGGSSRLGKNAAVGTRVYDRTSKFRVTVGPVDYITYKAFMPGGNNYLLINEIISVYINEPMISELLVTCKLSDLPITRLGAGQSDGGRLGRTAALGRSESGAAVFKIQPPRR
jgi:predicted component of type VI protein secretion system